MAYTVRSILGKIRLHRSDLREAELDYITQETVRKICRLTMLAQKMVVLPFVGPTAQLALTDSAGEDVNRVHLVRIQESTINTPSAPSFTSVTSWNPIRWNIHLQSSGCRAAGLDQSSECKFKFNSCNFKLG